MALVVLLALHGLPIAPDGTIPDGATATLRHMLVGTGGDADRARAGAGVNPLVVNPDDAAAAASDVLTVVRRDPNPRRRAARLLLERLNREGRWSPSVTDVHHALRSSPLSSVGVGREALAALVRVGWLEEFERRHAGREERIGLCTASRSAILHFIATGDGAPEPLSGWMTTG